MCVRPQRWYEICDEIGLYVVDEANIETHGLVCLGLPNPHSRLHLNASPVWRRAMLARVTRMVESTKNHGASFSPTHQPTFLTPSPPTRPPANRTCQLTQYVWLLGAQHASSCGRLATRRAWGLPS